jgi:hypothetical protein
LLNLVKRPFDSVAQHQRCLTETLSLPTAIWNLTTLKLKSPESGLLRYSDSPAVASHNDQDIHIEASIVYVDMVLRYEVGFKLTPDCIKSLIEYHKDVHCMDIPTNMYNWSEKQVQVEKLHEGFVHATNKFVYTTPVLALDLLKHDGSGRLQNEQSEEVKNSIWGLF